jgi:hypothetical protein
MACGASRLQVGRGSPSPVVRSALLPWTPVLSLSKDEEPSAASFDTVSRLVAGSGCAGGGGPDGVARDQRIRSPDPLSVSPSR